MAQREGAWARIRDSECRVPRRRRGSNNDNYADIKMQNGLTGNDVLRTTREDTTPSRFNGGSMQSTNPAQWVFGVPCAQATSRLAIMHNRGLLEVCRLDGSVEWSVQAHTSVHDHPVCWSPDERRIATAGDTDRSIRIGMPPQAK